MVEMTKKDYTQIDLYNGMKIFCLRKDEVKLIYEEVQAYTTNRIDNCYLYT